MKRTLLSVLMMIIVSASVIAQTSAQTPAPATGPAGKWQVTAVPNTPWVFEFTVEGATLLGTIRQTGAQNSPVTISDGKINGTTIAFKVKSPDGERSISFIGRVNGNEISFIRQITILPGGSRGGNDLFGASAALQFIAQRAKS